MSEFSLNNDVFFLVDGAEAVDKQLSEASAATDAGDYRAALDGFSKTLSLARHLFGENVELTELENSISEISDLLGE